MPTQQQQKVEQPKPVEPIKPAAGIVNSATTPPANEYQAPEVKPITTQVDADQETVENRLNKLTTSGNATLELQKNEAARDANTRGLVNSTMAVGAGRDALLRNAVPIATADAKTYTDTRMNNQASENEFLKNRQSANLNKETAGYQSQLTKDETQQRSDLTNEENTLLNELTMKRDEGLSELTQEEQTQLNELEMKRDEALSGQRIDEAGAQSQFDINRDNNSAELNEGLAAFESELKKSEMELDAQLKTDFELALNDAKFSDEMKLQIVSTMNNIIRDSNQQITDIGMSDRTAEQQATAIDLVKKNRDAELAVYQDLLTSFNDWDWGTNFTPESTTTLAEDNNYWNAPGGAKPINEPKVGDIINSMKYMGNGVWSDAFPIGDNYDDGYY